MTLYYPVSLLSPGVISASLRPPHWHRLHGDCHNLPLPPASGLFPSVCKSTKSTCAQAPHTQGGAPHTQGRSPCQSGLPPVSPHRPPRPSLSGSAHALPSPLLILCWKQRFATTLVQVFILPLTTCWALALPQSIPRAVCWSSKLRPCPLTACLQSGLGQVIQ